MILIPQLDFLVVPGGRGRLHEVDNQNLIHFIQAQFPHLKFLLSVCTGAFLVHQAHVLASSLITTYWRAIPEMQAFKDVKVVGERIVKNDKVWFAGGVSSGIDLALALIAEIADKETAGKVQLLFEYFPKDTVYANAELATTLPPYTTQAPAADLPEYIKAVIATSGLTRGKQSK
jgi:transcriptional regulator GlxA family with amidase domain